MGARWGWLTAALWVAACARTASDGHESAYGDAPGRTADPPGAHRRRDEAPSRHDAGGPTSPTDGAAERLVPRPRRSHGAPLEAAPYLTDAVLVQPRTPRALATIAARHGLEAPRPVGPSGWGRLRVPPTARARMLMALRADPDVRACAPEGRTWGAGGMRGAGGAALNGVAAPRQWHLHAANVPSDLPDLRGVTVAVLDTGVAYEDRSANGSRWLRAPSLRGVPFLSPADFIEEDGHPNDDHQHGTHIASLIASTGPVRGVAPGVALMPIKVLDRDDVGTELALVDGIHHAISHGADVINMSLSFGHGYVPSDALIGALERAAAAGVVLVAAAGNEGTERVTQPAANPLVLAVGALRPTSAGGYAPAPYANAGPRVDLVAPGGSVDEDRNADGQVDGLLAETIALQDPERVGLWLYAGTSQAAALVSATAARLLALGLDAPRVRATLLASAAPDPYANAPFADGLGIGRLDVGAALAAAPRVRAQAPRFVTILPWLAAQACAPCALPPMVRASALVTVLDSGGRRVPGATVIGTIEGAGGGTVACTTGENGACRVHGAWRAPEQTDAWTFHVDTIHAERGAAHPGAALFANAGLHGLVRESEGARRGAVLGFRWPSGTDAALGRMQESVAVAELSVARATVPRALLLAPGALADAADASPGSLAIGVPTGGEGVMLRVDPSDAGGAWGYRVWRSRGAASGMDVFEVDANALAASPLGVGARAVLAGQGPGMVPVLVGTGPFPGPLVTNRAAGLELSATALGDWLLSGGWPLRGAPRNRAR